MDEIVTSVVLDATNVPETLRDVEPLPTSDVVTVVVSERRTEEV